MMKYVERVYARENILSCDLVTKVKAFESEVLSGLMTSPYDVAGAIDSMVRDEKKYI